MYLLPTVNGFYFQQPKNLGIYVKSKCSGIYFVGIKPFLPTGYNPFWFEFCWHFADMGGKTDE